MGSVFHYFSLKLKDPHWKFDQILCTCVDLKLRNTKEPNNHDWVLYSACATCAVFALFKRKAAYSSRSLPRRTLQNMLCCPALIDMFGVLFCDNKVHGTNMFLSDRSIYWFIERWLVIWSINNIWINQWLSGTKPGIFKHAETNCVYINFNDVYMEPYSSGLLR